MSGCSGATSKSFFVPAYVAQQKPSTPGTPYQTSASASCVGYGCAQLTIAWSTASGADYYNIVDPSNNNSLVRGNVTGTSTTITGLYPGATIHLAVVAVNSAGPTQGSTATFTLPCPNGYTAQGNQCVSQTPQLVAPSADDCSAQFSSDRTTEVDLCWGYVNGAASYVVRDNRGFGGGLNGAGYNVGNQSIAHLTGTAPGTTVQAQVAAVDANGNVGPWSDIITMTTQQAEVAANMYISNTNTSETYPGQHINTGVYVTNSGNEDGITIVEGEIYWAYGGTCGDTSTTKAAGSFASSGSVVIPAGQTKVIDMVSDGAVASCYAYATLRLCFNLSGGQQYCEYHTILG